MKSLIHTADLWHARAHTSRAPSPRGLLTPAAGNVAGNTPARRHPTLCDTFALLAVWIAGSEPRLSGPALAQSPSCPTDRDRAAPVAEPSCRRAALRRASLASFSLVC